VAAEDEGLIDPIEEIHSNCGTSHHHLAVAQASSPSGRLALTTCAVPASVYRIDGVTGKANHGSRKARQQRDERNDDFLHGHPPSFLVASSLSASA
jgi:hypothetical protein